jgi:predicted 2-oxoglutarate/Fe(II)-dependent dioxygenase YbiX
MKNKFKSQKKEQKFAIIRNFISSDKAKKLSEEFKNYCEENPEDCPSDDQIPNTPAKHNYISFLEILCQKTSEVSEIIGESVLPTYSYARIYKNGDILKKHTDRDACEVSLTVHLDGDSEWEIFVESSNNESQSIKLQSGDALLYYGCDSPHWRDEYNGTFYSQVFLHYVKSRGSRQSYYFDKNNFNSENFELKDYIHVIENAIPLDLCDKIIEEYEHDQNWIGAEVGNGTIDNKTRNCKVINISHDSIIENNPLVRRKMDNDLFLQASNIIQNIARKYDHLRIKEDTGYELLKYEEGGFYTEHTDSYDRHPRILSCSLCLNDDYEGGEFAFFDKKIVYKLKKGSAILFPSNFMFPHQILPVIKGVRYSIITWFR